MKAHYSLKLLIFVCLFSLSCMIISRPLTGEDLSSDYLKIGIYDNPPKLFIDKNNQAKGIFPGIIEAIAKKEEWKIKFIPLSFKQGLEDLEKGTIDIMQDVAWSEKRSHLYGFTNETVMVSWGRVYKKKGLNIDTLIDLRGKRIAFMDGGIYSEGPDGLKTLMKKFELTATFIPVNGYKQVFEAIDQDKADAGVVNRLYGKTNKHKYDIDNTPILISPISIRFAFNKSNPVTPQLINTIDSHLVQFKNDDHSIYYQLIDEYIGEPKKRIPKSLKNLLIFLLILSCFFAALGILFNRQVQKKTAQLRKRDIELEESEKKFRTIFEDLQDVYFETTLSGTFKTVSPSAELILGFPTHELIHQPVDKIYHNIDDRKALIDLMLKDGKVRDYELLCKKKDNTVYWVSLNADLTRDDKGKPFGITGILRDITQQKNTEKKLIKREERFREMARLLPCGIVETDSDLNVTYANQTGLDMFGYTQADLENGLNGKNIIHPKDRRMAVQHIKKHLNGETTSPAEFRMNKKDGTPIIVLWNSNPIINKKEVAGFRGSLVDLTELKKLQKEVIRTQKLESTGMLAGGIAHDFNNILLGIFGNIALAKCELSSRDNAYKLLEEAEKSMSRAKELTTQLLTFAQGGDPIKQAITIDQVIRETATFNLTGSNIKVSMEKPEALWQVSADKGQISQVISNLVINARQAMPEGGSLNIKLENTAVSENDFSSLKLDQYVKITITDQGTGIPEKYLEKIFDPYFTTKQDGSGLGLAIVHSIILKHSGYIYVNSLLGKGTTFVIFLPAADRVETGEEKPMNLSTVHNEDQSIKILIMDDDPLVRDVSKRILNKLGHTVDICEDGSQAIEKYKQAMAETAFYDLVIMDLTIPGGMGGQKAIKELLKIDPSAKVVVASGYSNDPVLANYKGYGFKAVVTKPYTFEKIQHVIDKAMGS
ncbi:MAG: PAS domain S-box protein [Proteobacteria bacterium]|nr:PAS domain S-box protein [Pseudomonadota bacterium]MBU1582786.1 PAS domain S-box protein [Pseudomonadota bacterium]MBU2455537.1 PAS domain S-box protein [Pseudomonadota bacterium]MBU2631497.1 PAS domain S-box protein [Pseudomonadota bacterium]